MGGTKFALGSAGDSGDLVVKMHDDQRRRNETPATVGTVMALDGHSPLESP